MNETLLQGNPVVVVPTYDASNPYPILNTGLYPTLYVLPASQQMASVPPRGY